MIEESNDPKQALARARQRMAELRAEIGERRKALNELHSEFQRVHSIAFRLQVECGERRHRLFQERLRSKDMHG